MVDNSKVVAALERLEAELRKSGKDETASFFRRAIVTIDNQSDEIKLKEFLSQLCSSGAMSQYADFSYSEDVLFDKVYEESTKLLDQL